MSRKVEVIPYQLKWRDLFASESKEIAGAIAENLVAIHHIGSTSIPEISAKPIIDILVEVKDIKQVDRQNSAMEAIGYQIMGEYGISGRRYFCKDNEIGIRTHHVHMFAVNSAQVKRHLLFRDYLIAHPQEAQQYSELKQKLAKEYPYDIESYMDGKDEFIKEIDKKAAQWHKSSISDRSFLLIALSLLPPNSWIQ